MTAGPPAELFTVFPPRASGPGDGVITREALQLPQWPLSVREGVDRQAGRALVPNRLPQADYLNRLYTFALASGLSAGPLLSQHLAFNARALIVDNPSGYLLWANQLNQYIPAGASNYTLTCEPALNFLTISVVSGTQAAATTLSVRVTERDWPPTAGQIGGATLGSVSITGALPAGANQIGHVITDAGSVAANTPVAGTPDFGATGALGALNATVVLPMQGLAGASVTFPAGGTLVGSIVPEYSFDGGITWQGGTAFVSPVAFGGGAAFGTATLSSGNALQLYWIIVPPGTSHIRLRVSAYTSGTITPILRATTTAQQTLYNGNFQQLVSLQGGTSNIGSVNTPGPANVNTGQVTSGAAGTLVIARTTRKRALFKNTDATNSVAIGPATVTALNGMILKAGESMEVYGQILWQVIAIAGTPIVAFVDEYY